MTQKIAGLLKPKTVYRSREELDLTVLHIEISRDNYEFLKQMAKAKCMPMGGCVDVILRRKKEKMAQRSSIQEGE